MKISYYNTITGTDKMYRYIDLELSYNPINLKICIYSLNELYLMYNNKPLFRVFLSIPY